MILIIAKLFLVLLDGLTTDNINGGLSFKESKTNKIYIIDECTGMF